MNRSDQILAFIRRFRAEFGHSPSTLEIRDGVGLKSTATVHYHLDRLTRTGILTRTRGSGTRTLIVTGESIADEIAAAVAAEREACAALLDEARRRAGYPLSGELAKLAGAMRLRHQLREVVHA